LLLELVGGALGDDAAAVDHHDLVRELVGLLQILGGEQHGGPVLDELAGGVPELLAAARVEAAAGLVQEQHLGVADQACGQVQAAPHPARPGPHRAVGCLRQVEPLQQLAGAALALGPVQVVQAPDHDQVFPAGEVLVDRGGLAGQADHLPHGGWLAHHVPAGHLGVAGVGAQQGGQDAHGGGLAGAVGAEQPQDAAGWDGQGHLLQGLDVAEGLGQSLGLDRGLVAHPQPPKGRLTIASVTTYLG
jgi:hypothetical protein